MSDAQPMTEPAPQEGLFSAASSGAAPPNVEQHARREEPVLVAGAIRPAVFLLALPVLGEQMLNSFVGLFDTFLSGRISVDATNAVGLASYVGWLMSMLFMLVGTGTTALVSRAVGAGRPDEANAVAHQSLIVAVVNGVLCAVFMFLAAPAFATWQNLHGAAHAITVRFLRIDAVGNAFTSIALVSGAALRGAGDTRTPMKVMGAVNIVNMLMSAGLVWGVGPLPRCGVDGIVLGTLIARITGEAIMLAVLLRGRSGLRLRSDLLRPSWATIRRVLRIGVPAAGEGAVMWTGQFVFLLIIAHLAAGPIGKAYYAAHFIGVRVESLTYLPAVAWASAAATMIGQALGASKPDRARRVGHEAVAQCAALAVLSSTVFYVFAPAILRIMHDDPLVRSVGVPALRMVAFFQPCMAFSIVYLGGMRGAGATRFPLFITAVSMLAARLPLGYCCGIILHGGLIGAWIGMVADMSLRAVLATLRYRSGKWLHVKV